MRNFNNSCRFVSGQESEERAVPTCAKFAFACEFGSSNSVRRVYGASHNSTVSIHQVIQFLSNVNSNVAAINVARLTVTIYTLLVARLHFVSEYSPLI